MKCQRLQMTHPRVQMQATHVYSNTDNDCPLLSMKTYKIINAKITNFFVYVFVVLEFTFF